MEMANMENQVCRLQQQQQQQEFEIEEEFEVTEQDWAWLHKILDEEPAMANVASPSQPPVIEVEMENQHWPWQVLVAMPNVASPSQPQLQQQQQEVEMKEQDWPPQLLDQQPSASPVVYIGYQNDMQSINAELVEPPPHNLNNDSVTPSFVLEKQNKETKKPKERKQWTESEHKLFLTGLAKYGRNWKSISRYVETRTPTQVFSHAQKYFLRQQRDNKNRRPSIFYMTLPKENSTAQVMDQDVLPANKNSATAAPQPITDQVLWLNQMMQHQKYMYDVALFAMP